MGIVAYGQNATTNITGTLINDTLVDPVLLTTDAPTEGSSGSAELDGTITIAPTDAATAATTTSSPIDDEADIATTVPVQTTSPSIRGTAAATTTVPVGGTTPVPAPPRDTSSPTAATTTAVPATTGTDAPDNTPTTDVVTEAPTESPVAGGITAAPTVSAAVDVTSFPTTTATTGAVVTGSPTIAATVVMTGAPSSSSPVMATVAPTMGATEVGTTAIPINTTVPPTEALSMAMTSSETVIVEDTVDDTVAGNDTDTTQEIPTLEDGELITSDEGEEEEEGSAPAVPDGQCGIEPIGNTDFACSELLKFTSPDVQCDCFVYCSGKLIACLPFGERTSYSCAGETVAGCTESQRLASGASLTRSSTIVLLLSMLIGSIMTFAV